MFAAASRAPTGRTAAEAIDSDVMPIPTRTQASSGSAAASPQTPDRLAGLLARLGRDRDQLQHRRLPGVGEVGQVGGHPVGGHRVLGQVVGADRQEVDDLEHPVGQQRRRRHLDHHAGLEPALRAPRRRSSRPRRRWPPSAPSPTSRCRSRGPPRRCRRAGGSAGRGCRTTAAGRGPRGQGSPRPRGWRRPPACRSRRRGCGPRRSGRRTAPAPRRRSRSAPPLTARRCG